MSPKISFLIFIVFSFINISQQSRENHHDSVSSHAYTAEKKLSLKLVLKHKKFTPPETPLLSKDFFVSQAKYYPKSMEYYTNIEIGTPPQSMQLFIDTGSSYSWARCFKCKNSWATCFRDSYFQKENSKSYVKMPCNMCKCNWKGQCIYGQGYLDSSASTLIMSFETFGMSQDDGITQSKQELSNVPFGCATNTQRFWFMDGLLALGMGRFSFYSYLKDNYGVTMFSYCLLDQINEPEDQSDMLFGEQVVSNLTQFTPMIRDYYSSEHYAVELSGIQVEGEALDNYMFPIKMLVDSGSQITDLPSPVYNVLESKFRGVANELAWGRAINVSGNYPCYIIDQDQISASSTITFTFQRDAKLLLRPHNIWRYIDEDGAACFAFADASEISGINILGNIQQQGLRVIMDQTTEDRIGFDPSGC